MRLLKNQIMENTVPEKREADQSQIHGKLMFFYQVSLDGMALECHIPANFRVF